MLLILAPNPTFSQNDGYMQRVREIDSLFGAVPRVYLELGKKWNSVGLHPLNNGAYVLRIPFYCNQGILSVKLAPYFSSIYVHSIYQCEIYRDFLRNAVEISKKKVFLDLHGIVPEETFLASKDKRLTKKWSEIELLSVNLASKIICVTDQMKDHIGNKYNLSADKFISLPIIREEVKQKNEIDLFSKTETYLKSPHFIYAGGSQMWQRIDLMATVINNSKMNGKILSPNAKEFKKLIKRNIPIKAATPAETVNELKKAHFSFVLRENHIVNEVACPTKLIEAMIYGCLPIVESPNLGDFKSLGFSYLTLEDFTSGKLPSLDDYLTGIKNNKAIIDQLLLKYKENNSQFISNIIENNDTSIAEIELIDKVAKKERINSSPSFLLSRKIFSPRNLFRTARFFC